MKIRSALWLSSLVILSPAAVSAQAPAPKSVQLSKVVLDTESSELTARVKGGTLCVFPSNVKIPKEKKTQDYERFDNLFSGKLKSGGYTVVSTSSEMFGADDDKNKGDYLVGVTLRPTTMNLCSSVKGDKGDLEIAAEWQIYDRASGTIVEKVTTTGRGVQAKFAADGQKQMLDGAFADNLAKLLDQGVLKKYVAAAGGS